MRGRRIVTLFLMLALGVPLADVRAEEVATASASSPGATTPEPTAASTEPVASQSAHQPALEGERQASPVPAALSDQTTTRTGAPMTLPKDAPVFVSVKHSNKLAELIRAELVKQGYQMAQSEPEAAVLVELDGLYKAKRQTTGRTAKAIMGLMVETPNSFHSERAPSFDVVGGWSLLTALVAQTVLFASDVTGVRDSANKSVAGDPDGICASKCDQRAFNQVASVAVAFTREGRRVEAGVMVSGVSDDLQPDTLFARALTLLLGDMGVQIGAIGFPEVARK